MAPELRPVGTGFFPAARVGLAVGIVVAFVGAGLWKDAAAAPRATEMPADAEPVAPTLVAGSVIAVPRDVSSPMAPIAPITPYVGLPLRGPVVAHVWLENCADCMSAFAAFREVRQRNELEGLPQVNVAYGSSTKEFAARYRVDDNLVVDRDGSLAVKPFGIGSFTTLVLDKDGAVIHRDRPDHAGYVERVKDAWARAHP